MRADYRELPFADASFDAAINLFTSLGYLGDEEDTRALAEIGRVLQPGARLVLELMHRDRLVRRLPRAGLAGDAGRAGCCWSSARSTPPPDVAQVTQTLIDGAGGRESRSVLDPRLHRDRAAGDARRRRLRRRALPAATSTAARSAAPTTRLVVVATR